MYKTAIASRSHFYVLLMMMIECESIVPCAPFLAIHCVAKKSGVFVIHTNLFSSCEKYSFFHTCFSTRIEQTFLHSEVPLFGRGNIVPVCRFVCVVKTGVRARNFDLVALCVGVIVCVFCYFFLHLVDY